MCIYVFMYLFPFQGKTNIWAPIFALPNNAKVSMDKTKVNIDSLTETKLNTCSIILYCCLNYFCCEKWKWFMVDEFLTE